MSLEQQITQQMKEAMKAKDQGKLRAVRAIKSAILLAKTEKGAGSDLTDKQETKLLQKLAKQRKDSIAIYEKEGRDDLLAKEQEELQVIETFLPEMMGEDEIREKVQTIIEKMNASGMQDMGKVMGKASQQFAGKADMSLVSQIVKKQLA